MPKKVKITTPFPTIEEVARELKVPKKRAKRIAALAEKNIEKGRNRKRKNAKRHMHRK